MTIVTDTHPDRVGRIDGRRARRDRNVSRVLEAAIDLFGDHNVVPTMEQIASRAGVSLRSLYRYYPDADGLLAAAIAFGLERARERAAIRDLGRGSLAERIDALVDTRLRVLDASADNLVALTHHATTSPAIRDALDAARRAQRDQFRRQFATELAGADNAVAEAADLLTQVESVALLQALGTDRTATARVLKSSLQRLLAP